MAQILTICMRQVRFEKSHGKWNFGFDLLASVRFLKNLNRTEIQFPRIPIIQSTWWVSSSSWLYLCIVFDPNKKNQLASWRERKVQSGIDKSDCRLGTKSRMRIWSNKVSRRNIHSVWKQKTSSAVASDKCFHQMPRNDMIKWLSTRRNVAGNMWTSHKMYCFCLYDACLWSNYKACLNLNHVIINV